MDTANHLWEWLTAYGVGECICPKCRKLTPVVSFQYAWHSNKGEQCLGTEERVPEETQELLLKKCKQPQKKGMTFSALLKYCRNSGHKAVQIRGDTAYFFATEKFGCSIQYYCAGYAVKNGLYWAIKSEKRTKAYLDPGMYLL